MNNFKNNPRYSSINLEEAGIFKGGTPNVGRVRNGYPTISKFGFSITFRNRPQHRDILNFLKVYKSEKSVIDIILTESTPKEASKRLKVQYNFSNNILKSII